MNVLVTGGSGYIGSHTCVVLLQAGYDVTIVDSLVNSRRDVIDRIELIAGRKPTFVQGDVRDRILMNELLSRDVVAVMHFAGLKAVGESVAQPLMYYDSNVSGAVTLLQAMAESSVRRLIFSSSATVYGDPATVPIREDFPTGATNPYGRSKLMIEEILGDIHLSDPAWEIARLRYFNPVGAHESGLLGEAPNGVPNNLMPYVAQVAAGKRQSLSVFGNDYPTRDGTGIRDYIHVVDLAEGHLAALRYLENHGDLITVNLGTGRGCSVLEMIAAFENTCGQSIPYRIVDRRPGDVAECWADPTLAQQLLQWEAQRDVDDMCRDTWRWQSKGCV